jgi:hypothetical protein
MSSVISPPVQFPDILKHEVLFLISDIDTLISLCLADPVFFHTCSERKNELFKHLWANHRFMNSFAEKAVTLAHNGDFENVRKLLTVLPSQAYHPHFYQELHKELSQVPNDNKDRTTLMVYYILVLLLRRTECKLILYTTLLPLINELYLRGNTLEDHIFFTDVLTNQMAEAAPFQQAEMLALVSVTIVKGALAPFVSEKLLSRKSWMSRALDQLDEDMVSSPDVIDIKILLAEDVIQVTLPLLKKMTSPSVSVRKAFMENVVSVVQKEYKVEDTKYIQRHFVPFLENTFALALATRESTNEFLDILTQ